MAAVVHPEAMSLLNLPTITCHGSPHAMGTQHGEALRDAIAAFIDVRRRAARAWLYGLGIRDEEALAAIARQCLAIHQAWDPAGCAEHHGIATGANVDPVWLYAATNYTDLRDVLAFGSGARATIGDLDAAGSAGASGQADAEGCTTTLLPPTHTANGRWLAAQTWDLNPPDVDYVVAIHRLPDDGPETWSVTCAGCLSLMSMNQHGFACGTTNIKTTAARPGVGYLGLLHRLARCADRSEAATQLRSAPRAAAHTYWLADADGIMEAETDADQVVERAVTDRPITRTNHCLAKPFMDRQAEAPYASSQARLARSQVLADVGGHDIASIKALFSDRADGVDSINRYAEDDQGTATNSVFIAEPASRMVTACRGPADRGAWIDLPFDR